MEHKIDYSISGALRPDELGELLSLVFEGEYTPRELSRLIAGSTAYVTARHDGILVGFGRILTDGATMAYINYMAVSPNYQRQGIGQQVLKLLVDTAADVKSIFLYTNTADALYLRNGFQRSEKRLYVFRKPAEQ